MVSNSSFWRPTISFFMFSDLSYKNLVVVLSVVAGDLGFHTKVAFLAIKECSVSKGSQSEI